MPETGKEIQENKMGTAPILKLVLAMSGPAMLSMLIGALYNIIDSMFVARGVGESGLTALTLVFPVQMIFVAVGVGTGVGINSVVSRRLGAKRFEEAGAAASASIKLALISWSFFALLGFFGSRTVMGFFTDVPVILEQGTKYMTIVMVFGLFGMVQLMVEKTIQSVGNMIMPMVANVTGVLVNIVLDPIMIFGLLGCPRMGVVGAAVATVIGQAVSAAGLLYILTRKVPEVAIHPFAKIPRQTIKDIYAVGVPGIALQTVASLANFVMNYILAGFSPTAVAVMGVYNRLQSFIFMPVFGLNQGTTPIFGYNYGAGNRARLVQTLKTAYTAALIIMGVGLLLFQLIPETLLSIFGADETMTAIGVQAFRAISICFLPAAIGIVTGSVFNATGHGFISLLSSLIRQLVFIIPGAIIFARIGGLDLVWWTFPMSEIFGLTFSLLMLRWIFKHEINKMGPQEADPVMAREMPDREDA